jgi:hypothetical protein
MIGTMQYLQCCSVLVSILPREQRKWSTKERRNGSAYTPCARLMPPLSLCHCLACLVARHCEPVRLWWRSCGQSCIDHYVQFHSKRQQNLQVRTESMTCLCVWLCEYHHAGYWKGTTPLCFFCLVQCFANMPWCHGGDYLRFCFSAASVCASFRKLRCWFDLETSEYLHIYMYIWSYMGMKIWSSLCQALHPLKKIDLLWAVIHLEC